MKPTAKVPFTALETVCRPIRRLSTRARRRIARETFYALCDVGVTPRRAREIAKAVTAAPHCPTLSLSEALAALKRHDIKISRSSVFRIAKKALLIPRRTCLEVYMNRDGDWGPEAEITTAVVKVDAWYGSDGKPSFLVTAV